MKKASEQELWYENIRYRFYPGLQVTFDKKTVNIRFAYKKNNGFSIADYNNPDEKKARNLQVINELPQNQHFNNPIHLSPGGSIPHNLAKTFDGPPTLERSGSEHREGAVTSLALLERARAWEWVKDPPQELGDRRQMAREISGIAKTYPT